MLLMVKTKHLLILLNILPLPFLSDWVDEENISVLKPDHWSGHLARVYVEIIVKIRTNYHHWHKESMISEYWFKHVSWLLYWIIVELFFLPNNLYKICFDTRYLVPGYCQSKHARIKTLVRRSATADRQGYWTKGFAFDFAKSIFQY